MGTILRLLLNAWRSLFGEGTAVERLLRAGYRTTVRRAAEGERSAAERAVAGAVAKTRLRVTGEYTGRNYTVFRGPARGEGRLGIFAKGSCDLPSVFVAKPLLQPHVAGVAAILREGNVSEARSDILLQSLDGVPEALTRETVETLKLPERYFAPSLFEPTFTIPDHPELGTFPKSVVILSIAADLTRTGYRHREHGFLLDPGGAWLDQEAEFLANVDKVKWVHRHYESIGRLDVGEFHENMSTLVRLVRERTGAEVLVYNALTVEPEKWLHSYQFVPESMVRRRREFGLALVELSRKLDLSIVDVDRALKRDGVEGQLDFAHFPLDKFHPIAAEVFRVLREREVV